VRQPGISHVDLSLFKSFKMRERASVTFRLEAFNALNHTQFGPAGSSVGTIALGVVSSTGNDPRQVQAALRSVFH
jgi:hypothetical protein